MSIIDKTIRWLNGYRPEEKEDTGTPSIKQIFNQKREELEDAIEKFWHDDSVVKTHQAYQAMLGIPRFSHLLPYAGYIDNASLFVLDEGGIDDSGEGILNLGFTIEIQPQTGSDNNMEKVLQSIFLQAPPETGISVQLYASPDIMPRMIQKNRNILTDAYFDIKKEPWERRNKNIYRRAAGSRAEFYKKGGFKSLLGEGRNYLLKDFRLIISVVMPDNYRSEEEIKKAIEFRESVMSSLRSAHFPGVIWNQDDLLNWVSDWLRHERVLEPGNMVYKNYDPLMSLRDQFSSSGGLAKIQSDSIEMLASDSELVTMTVKEFPKNWKLSDMGNMIGDYFQGSLSYSCPFLITMLASTKRHEEFKMSANIKAADKKNKASSQAGRLNPSLAQEAQEWEFAQKVLEDGATMVDMAVKVTLITKREQSRRATTDASAIWSNKGFTIVPDLFLQALSFKATIPMGLTRPVMQDMNKMGHFGRKFSTNAVALSPMIAEWKGTANNTLTLFGRRGQIMGFDLYDNNAGNMNFAVVAASGAGKSFWLNEIALCYLGVGGKVWIIDVGRSYEKLCSVLGGDFIEFTEDANICINPFTSVHNIDEDMEMLKPLISYMMTQGNGSLDGVDMSNLEQAVKAAFRKFGQNCTMTNVRDELLDMCKDEGVCPIRDMATMLYPWTKDGMYGKYFEGPATIDFKNDFTVLELEELKSKKTLQAVVLMLLMYRITDEMYVQSRDRKKVCIIDEAWDLMGGGSTAEFIEGGYRRARKYNGAFGTATQSIEDYYKNPGATAALNNADWLFLLRQKKESIERLEKEGRMAMDAWQKRVLLNITTEQGLYSEVFVSSPVGSGVGRLLVDPFSKILYSSKAEDFQAVKKFESMGFDTADAIDQVLKARGHNADTYTRS